MAAEKSPVWRGPSLNIPPGFRLLMSAWAIGFLMAFFGIVCLILSPFTGAALSDSLWAVEPLSYVGAIVVISGLFISASGLGIAMLKTNWRNHNPLTPEQQSEQWRETTRQFFELFDHDLGRPLRRIAGKERELRAAMRAAGGAEDPAVQELLDEIARQTPNFRLMLSNIQVLVQLEAPGSESPAGPVEPAEVVRRIADRYFPVAIEAGKELTWWAEPQDFGIVSSDSHAIEHIVANLVDNAVTHASRNVEISLTRDDTGFYIHVWDDGPGIASHYLEYLFDRGWTPEVGQREEKTSSGLGLFIARTLSRRCGGELTVESVAAPQTGHHTAFLLALPLKG